MGGIKHFPEVFLTKIMENFGQIQLFRTTAWMPNSRRHMRRRSSCRVDYSFSVRHYLVVFISFKTGTTIKTAEK